MTRRRKDPLRPFTDAERRELTRLRQSPTAPAAVVIRASVLLLVSSGASYQGAARATGRQSGDAVSHLVARFNQEGLAALEPRHGGGRAVVYDVAARDRILREVEQRPTPEHDGTATWSLSTLRRALRSVADGLPRISTFTLWRVLHEAGYSHQQTRTWCPTGTALRKRKAGVVTVTDPDAGPKKS
jgi:transposase